jgi:hypothetical protein
MLDAVDLDRDVGENEVLVVFRRKEVHATIRQVHRVAAFIQDVEKLVLDCPELLLRGRKLPVRDVGKLGLLHQLHHALLLERLQQPLVLRGAETSLVQQKPGSIFVAVLQGTFPFPDEVVRDFRLLSDQSLDGCVVLGVLRVAFRPHRAGNDETCVR